MSKKQNIGDVGFIYVIFITPIGKGYGCFAIETKGNNSFRVAASFCHPDDRAVFSKKKARELASERLAESNFDYSFNEEVTVEYSGIVIRAFADPHNPIQTPSWVREAFSTDAFIFTLRADNNSIVDFIYRLDLGGEWAVKLCKKVQTEHLYKAKGSHA